MNIIKDNRTLYKSLIDKGYKEINGVLHTPTQVQQMISAGTYIEPVRKRALNRIKTAWIDDTLNIKNRDTRLDAFCRLIHQQLSLSVWTEFRFLLPPLPDYRFDYAIPIDANNNRLMIAVEVNGGVWCKGNSGHSSGSGISRDMDKASQAAAHGWILISVQPSELLTDRTLNLIRKAITTRGF